MDGIDVLENFKDKLTIEKSYDENGTVTLTITPTENNSLPALRLYTAIYSSNGALKSAAVTNCEITDKKAVLSVAEPSISSGEQYKLILLTDEQAPLIKAINNKIIGFFNKKRLNLLNKYVKIPS
ncbi:MAG: hypothetical protein J6N52_12720 [Clostridia bacterium]|nr:hypothetical protein [Clostridia bacterium]